MSTATVLDREEYIEQAYLFRTVRERLADNQAAQEILQRVHEELLSSTRLPYAVQFLVSELKHTGLVANGFSKLPHYFTAFQAFVVKQAEDAKSKFPMPTAFLVLEREAAYRADRAHQAGAVRVPVRDHRPQPARLPRRAGGDGRRPVLRRRLARVLRHPPQGGGRDRLQRPGVRAVGDVRDRGAAAEPGVRAGRAADLRGEGGEDREGQPPPRPAVPVRRAPAATRLPGGAAATASATTLRRNWTS